MNFQVNDNTNTAGSPGEVLSRRCVTLLKTALRPDMWSKSELKLQWFDKLLMSVVSAGICCYCLGLGLGHQNRIFHSFVQLWPLPLCLLATLNLKNKIIVLPENSRNYRASLTSKGEELYFLEKKKEMRGIILNKSL